MKTKIPFFAIAAGMMVALMSALPLAWVAPLFVKTPEAQTAQFSGTIWRGIANIPFGKSRAPISFKTNPLELAAGQPFLDVSIRNAGIDVEAIVGLKTAKDIQIRSNIAQLPLLDPRIRGLSGMIKADVSDARFVKSEYGRVCRDIKGQMSTNFLQANEGTWFWRGPALTGPISCDDGDIIAKLTGQDKNAAVTAQFRLQPDGVYTSNIDITAPDARAVIVLEFYGFTQNGNQLTLSEMGRWK